MRRLRSPLTALAALTLFCLALTAAQAHHGWRWAEDVNSELTGTVTATKLGNPHGELTLDVEGESWTVEVGQPWRNERAGLKRELLQVGTTVTIRGHKSVDPGERLMKAERVVIDGQVYDLYPDRD